MTSPASSGVLNCSLALVSNALLLALVTRLRPSSGDTASYRRGYFSYGFPLSHYFFLVLRLPAVAYSTLARGFLYVDTTYRFASTSPRHLSRESADTSRILKG